MTTIIILAAIYAISFYATFKYIQIAFSKGGVWSHISTDRTDLFFTIMPFFNTMFLLLWVLEYPKGNNNLNNFFKVKKD